MSDIREEFYPFPARLVASDVREHTALDGIESPFVRKAEISNNRLDAFFSRMAQSTLSNFAGGAENGVSVLDSHDSGKLGVGYSFTGQMSQGGDGAMTVLSDWYTVPGIRFGGKHSYESTDDYIRAVEAKLVREISVGFYGGRQVCDICHQRYYSWDCPHIAGLVYEIEDENGQRDVQATTTIHDATLAEYSLVYKGATPGAAIRKIEREIKRGELTQKSIEMLERRYRLHLPASPKTFLINGRSADKNNTEERMELEKTVELVRAVLAETNAPEGELPDAVRWLADENARLRPLADAGRQYRTDLIDEAIAEGVRAMGEGFAQETYRATLEGSSIDVIKRMRDDWKALASKRFAGGRQTNDNGENAPGKEARTVRLVPDEAYG